MDLRMALEKMAGNRRLALALALAAIVFMLPTLRVGLFVDDLVQRVAQLSPAELPPRMLATGFVPPDSGELATVLTHLFGYVRDEESAALAKAYGLLPWWAPESWRGALWRPFTSLSHWLDYQWFPDTPALMHAHNIMWYAAAVLLAGSLYRRLAPPGAAGRSSAALAACFFLLDKNFYAPVMYVANRGFIIALVFGLLTLQQHRRWRTTESRAAMWCSVLCLLVSLLANEAGASTLAFVMAYALVLEPNGWWPRMRSLVPALVAIVVWRVIYAGCGFGVHDMVGYVDPGYAPSFFLQHLASRTIGLLGGQLSGVPPELRLALSSEWQALLAAGFTGFTALCGVAFLPTLRRDRTARFWAATMLLALVPAATVAPFSKNLGFVAIGAFGLIATFLIGFSAAHERAAMRNPLWAVSWCIAIWLVVAHGPGAVAARAGMAWASAFVPEAMAGCCSFQELPEIGDRDVVLVNDPPLVATMVPFYRAYRGRPLPRTISILVPGGRPLEVARPDASTLVLTAMGGTLFDCPPLGPIHACYVCAGVDEFIFGAAIPTQGTRVRRAHFVAEVLEVGERGMPRSVAFRFDRPLESERTVWVFFDWSHHRHAPFVLPEVGARLTIAGS